MTAPTLAVLAAALDSDAALARVVADEAGKLLRPARTGEAALMLALGELASRLARRAADLRVTLADLGALGAGLLELPEGGAFS
jgi:hypothetical protein